MKLGILVKFGGRKSAIIGVREINVREFIEQGFMPLEIYAFGNIIEIWGNRVGGCESGELSIFQYIVTFCQTAMSHLEYIIQIELLVM